MHLYGVVCLEGRTEIDTRLLLPNAVEDRKKETLVAFNGFIRDVILNIPVIACRLCRTGPEEGLKIWLGKQHYVQHCGKKIGEVQFIRRTLHGSRFLLVAN